MHLNFIFHMDFTLDFKYFEMRYSKDVTYKHISLVSVIAILENANSKVYYKKCSIVTLISNRTAQALVFFIPLKREINIFSSPKYIS